MPRNRSRRKKTDKVGKRGKTGQEKKVQLPAFLTREHGNVYWTG